MDLPKRSIDKSEPLHIDSGSRGESSISVHRSQSGGYEPFVPSPGSSIGASVSMFSSRNSELGDTEELDKSRTIMLHIGIADMINDKEIQQRYPGFYQFLVTEQPTWFEPAPLNGTTHRVSQRSTLPENHRKLRKELTYEMLDLMYRFYRQKIIDAHRKRENKELMEANKQLRIAAVQMFTKAEQEEEYISNNLLKKIQQLNQDKDYLVKKYQKDEESLTKSLMANVAKIPDVHAEETEKLMADKEAEIERLRAYCSRAEKSYQEELKRLRAEKVDHESALEKEQELLINTLGKRMSQMNEEKRKMQNSLEVAYMNGFVEYDESVEMALRASIPIVNGSNSISSPFRATDHQNGSKPQLSEIASLQLENKNLLGKYNQTHRRLELCLSEVKKLTYRMAKMEMNMECLRAECIYGDGSDERASGLFCEQCESPGKASAPKKHASSPPTNVVIGQPSTSRSGTSTLEPHSSQTSTPILATVFPTQRNLSGRSERQ